MKAFTAWTQCRIFHTAFISTDVLLHFTVVSKHLLIFYIMYRSDDLMFLSTHTDWSVREVEVNLDTSLKRFRLEYVTVHWNQVLPRQEPEGWQTSRFDLILLLLTADWQIPCIYFVTSQEIHHFFDCFLWLLLPCLPYGHQAYIWQRNNPNIWEMNLSLCFLSGLPLNTFY